MFKWFKWLKLIKFIKKHRKLNNIPSFKIMTTSEIIVIWVYDKEQKISEKITFKY